MARPHHTRAPFEFPSNIFVDECCDSRWASRPLTQRELRAAAALGTVLDHRAWWIKWTRHPTLRITWLTEIEAELVRATVTQLADGWADHEHYEAATSALLEMRKCAGDVAHTLREVLYPPPDSRYEGRDDYPFNDGSHFESDGEGQDDEGEERDDDALVGKIAPEVSNRDKNANPFVRILWYAKMEVLRDRLRELPPPEWTTEWLYGVFDRIDTVDRDTVLRRVYSLIQATRDHEA